MQAGRTTLLAEELQGSGCVSSISRPRFKSRLCPPMVASPAWALVAPPRRAGDSKSKPTMLPLGGHNADQRHPTENHAHTCPFQFPGGHIQKGKFILIMCFI